MITLVGAVRILAPPEMLKFRMAREENEQFSESTRKRIVAAALGDLNREER